MNQVESEAGTTLHAVCGRKRDNLEIYPNPAGSSASLVSETMLHNSTIEILDEMGQTKKIIENVNINANEKFEINLNEIQDGYYQLKIICHDAILRRKLIISR